MIWLRSWHEAAARRELAALLGRLGKVGITPAAQAAVDQHAAAIRDILSVSPGRIGPIELAGYAKGIEDAARQRGWRPSKSAQDLDDWIALRLAAACSLADSDPVTLSDGNADLLPS